MIILNLIPIPLPLPVPALLAALHFARVLLAQSQALRLLVLVLALLLSCLEYQTQWRQAHLAVLQLRLLQATQLIPLLQHPDFLPLDLFKKPHTSSDLTPSRLLAALVPPALHYLPRLQLGVPLLVWLLVVLHFARPISPILPFGSAL